MPEQAHNLDAWRRLADEAAGDPSRAADVSRLLAAELGDAASSGARAAPPGYLYDGGRTWIFRVRNLDPIPLPTDANPQRPGATTPPGQDSGSTVQVRVPFPAWVQKIHGWAVPVMAQPGLSGLETVASTAADGRDLFACRIMLNGDTGYSSSGQDGKVFNAAAMVGTRLNPRPAAWMLQRRDLVTVSFKNITNVLTSSVAQVVPNGFRLAEVVVAMTVLKMAPP